MALFVINRHGEENPEVTEEQEKEKLDQILRRVERKKQQRIRQREREKEKRRPQKTEIQSEEPREESQNEKQSEVAENHESKEIEEPPTKVRKLLDPTSVYVSSFTVLGVPKSTKKTKAARVLPQWLKNPTIISSNLQTLTAKVSKMKQLDKSIRNQLKSNGIKYLFPVQAEVIPYLLQSQNEKDIVFPRDICVSAPTGSGKTLAFVLPVIQALKKYTVRKIRALVILPTQDLAEQVFKSFKTYSKSTNIEVGLVTGKHLFDVEQKHLGYFSPSFGYVSKIDVLVCTAGRLVGHLKSTQGFNLQSLEFLVIDEADRVLESVQDDWLYHVEKHISRDDYTVQNRKILNLCTLRKQRSPQKLLFSATLTQDPEKIEKLSLFQPKLFTSVVESETADEKQNSFVGKYVTPKELTEKYILSSKDLKPLVLYTLIKRENLTKTIVFTHSVESAHRLKILLQSLFKTKLKIDEISSSSKGKKRDSLISDFAKGDVDVLICTDFLARGIDLPGVRCVVSYSAPKHLKTYIHRVGRTARAGETGLAVTLLHVEQLGAFKGLFGHTQKEIEEVRVDEEELEALGKKYKRALSKLKEAVDKEEKEGRNSVMVKKKAVKRTKNKHRMQNGE